jgi:hypothetical protein
MEYWNNGILGELHDEMLAKLDINCITRYSVIVFLLAYLLFPCVLCGFNGFINLLYRNFLFYFPPHPRPLPRLRGRGEG